VCLEHGDRWVKERKRSMKGFKVHNVTNVMPKGLCDGKRSIGPAFLAESHLYAHRTGEDDRADSCSKKALSNSELTRLHVPYVT